MAIVYRDSENRRMDEINILAADINRPLLEEVNGLVVDQLARSDTDNADLEEMIISVPHRFSVAEYSSEDGKDDTGPPERTSPLDTNHSTTSGSDQNRQEGRTSRLDFETEEVSLVHVNCLEDGHAYIKLLKLLWS